MSGAPSRTPSCSVIEQEDPDSADAVVLMQALGATLAAITGSTGNASFDANDVRGARACFVVARDGEGKPVGCGAFRPLREGAAIQCRRKSM